MYPCTYTGTKYECRSIVGVWPQKIETNSLQSLATILTQHGGVVRHGKLACLHAYFLSLVRLFVCPSFRFAFEKIVSPFVIKCSKAFKGKAGMNSYHQTHPFIISEPEMDKLCVVQKRHATDLKALML